MDKKLTVCTVNYNTSDFIRLMIFSLEKLTYYPFKIIICDNGSFPNEIVKLKKYISEFPAIDIKFIERQQTQAGSIGHAEALDLLLEKTNTEFFVTMDADATILKKDWDKILIENMGTAKAIGTPVVVNNKKKSDFPLVFCAFYDTKTLKQYKCTFMPKNIEKGEDTGHDLRNKFKENNIDSVVLKAINTRFEQDKYYDGILCAVYYLEDTLICSHFGRGSSSGGAKYKQWYYWKLPIVSKKLRNLRYKNEKKEWIDRSEKIVIDECSI